MYDSGIFGISIMILNVYSLISKRRIEVFNHCLLAVPIGLLIIGSSVESNVQAFIRNLHND